MEGGDFATRANHNIQKIIGRSEPVSLLLPDTSDGTCAARIRSFETISDVRWDGTSMGAAIVRRKLTEGFN